MVSINLMRKTARYILFSLFLVIVLAFCVASYVLLNIHKCQDQVKYIVNMHMPFSLDFTGLHGRFNSRAQPTLEIENLSLKNLKTKVVFFKLKKISFSLSYRSIYKFEVLFSNILLNGSSLNIEYDKNENILLNKQIITNLKHSKPPSFSIEDFMLKLDEFKLTNLDLEFFDSHDGLNPIILRQINMDLINYANNKHTLLLNSRFVTSNLNLKLDWQGIKFSNLNKWKNGDLIIINQDSLNHNINLHAKIKNGELETLTTNFDTNGNLILVLNNPLQGKSVVSGSLKIIKQSESLFNVIGKDLVVKTESGYVLNHASLNGSYEMNKLGRLNLTSLDLAGLSSFKLNPLGNKVNLHGSLKNINLTWSGGLTSPKQAIFLAEFNNIAITSIESDIPSLNNMDGNFTVQSSSGVINLSLKDSKLVYPKIFKQPIIIKQLNHQMNWNVESNHEVVLNWHKSNVQTKDFDLITSGVYSLKTNSTFAEINIAKLEIAKIPNYLPYNESSITNFIRSNITKGSLSNTNLVIKGKVTELPYAKGKGALNFSTQLNDIAFKFADNWPAVTNLNGILSAHNQIVGGMITTGQLGNYVVSNTHFSIGNITADDLTLKMDGFASGFTIDLLNYLRGSPLAPLVKTLPPQTKISGKSKIALKLNLPLNKPSKLHFSGNWLFLNNVFDLDKSIPTINNLNGKLNFSNNGIESSHLTANILGSNLDAFVTKKVITVSSPALDYSKVYEFFTHNHSDLISGKALSKVVYDINTSTIIFYSDLAGVTIHAPEPMVVGKNWTSG